ncbi:MAG: type II toxin-antitoxin system RelE/ParE family toxin [Candidatus Peribacteraceae bacterium]
MTYQVQYSDALNIKEIARFPAADLKRIKAAIERKLPSRPEIFGKPLRFSLKGHRSLHIGEYRVIFRIEKRIVRVLIIAHRSTVYQD